MVLAAAVHLENNKSMLDALNVFPVPDGDTGTNMSLTMMSAAKEVKTARTDTVTSVANALSMGALKGARGNSGVILSQLFRGFAKALEGELEHIDADQFAKAMELGVEAAYKAVMRPKEGTILTVAKDMARKAKEVAVGGANMLLLIDRVLEAGQESLARTPELLPVLKEAGVVDAGGKGLIVIYQGFKMALDGEEITIDSIEKEPVAASIVIAEAHGGEDITFAYCTEFFIKNVFDYVGLEDLDKFREKLARIGDCVLVVGDLQLIKVHVHTNMPGKVLQIALRLGVLSGIKIDNMREQHSELQNGAAALAKPKEMKEMAIVSVASGKGIEDILQDFGTDVIVEGGQTMNPSAEDIAKAVEKAPSNNVFIMPNNKNIILAAESAQDLTQKKLFVVPSKSIPQGISALLAFHPDYTAEDNFERMKAATGNVKTGQVTKAVRTTKVNGYDIKEGDYIGMFDGDIVCSGESLKDTPMALLKKMVTPNDCVIAMFYGEDAPQDQAEAFAAQVREEFPDCDLEVHHGGQPVYDYIFSVE
jgi:DAK2 domain fusion protein YloV